MNTALSPITIRPAHAQDVRALARLAALDSAALPPMPMLVGEVDGELQAAVSLRDGRAIADPFRPTALLVTLLRTQAAAETTTRTRPSARHRYRLSVA